MARFRATVQGGRGQASRLGHRSITTDANGWNLGVNVAGGTYGGDNDRFTVYATGGSSASSASFRIAEVAEVEGERVITLFDVTGHILAQYTA